MGSQPSPLIIASSMKIHIQTSINKNLHRFASNKKKICHHKNECQHKHEQYNIRVNVYS
jgi:hypothetical protein